MTGKNRWDISIFRLNSQDPEDGMIKFPTGNSRKFPKIPEKNLNILFNFTSVRFAVLRNIFLGIKV